MIQVSSVDARRRLRAVGRAVGTTVHDLPAGWKQTSAGRDRQPGDPARTCVDRLFEELDVFVRDDQSSAANAFESTGMLLNTVVVRGYTEAEQYLEELPAEADACDGSADGEGDTVSVLPLAFAALGDDTFATHIELHLPTKVTVLLAFTRVGDFVVMAFVLGTGGEDPSLLDDVMRTMVGRLQRRTEHRSRPPRVRHQRTSATRVPTPKNRTQPSLAGRHCASSSSYSCAGSRAGRRDAYAASDS